MKKLCATILLFYRWTFVCNAQEAAEGELIIWIKDNTLGKLVRIDVDLVSSLCWDAINFYFDVHDITEQYPGSSQYTNSTYPYSLDWEACWSYPGYEHGFGLGQYRVTALVYEHDSYLEQDNFYIDYRTSDLSENFNSGGQGDVAVDFNVTKHKFYYHETQTVFPANTTIWDEKPWIDNITTELEPLPPTNLVQTATSGPPILQWQHASVTPNWRTGYIIYLSVTSPNNFAAIGSVSANTNTFVDNSVLLGGGGPVYYKVTAIKGTRESVFSNTFYVIIDLAEKIKQQDKITIETYNRLDQNYPNPFNPLTKITFSIKENTFVTLTVFDILGREVAVLVNEVLNQGNHKVHFDGSSLESGIYFYEITADNFRDVKKLILLK